MKIRNIVLGLIVTLLASTTAPAQPILDIDIDWLNSPYSMAYGDISPISMMATITNNATGDLLLNIDGASFSHGDFFPDFNFLFNVSTGGVYSLDGVTLSAGETSTPFEFGTLTPKIIVAAGTYVSDGEVMAINDHEYDFSSKFTVNVEPVPEPATMLLLGTGLVGVAGAVRRGKKNQA